MIGAIAFFYLVCTVIVTAMASIHHESKTRPYTSAPPIRRLNETGIHACVRLLPWTLLWPLGVTYLTYTALTDYLWPWLTTPR